MGEEPHEVNPLTNKTLIPINHFLLYHFQSLSLISLSLIFDNTNRCGACESHFIHILMAG